MELKTCRICKDELDISNFDVRYVNKSGVNVYKRECVVCDKKRHKKYRDENKSKLKDYYQNNKEQIRENQSQNYQLNKEARKEYSKQYRKDNEEKVKKTKKNYQQNNKSKVKAYQDKYQQDNREQINEVQRKYCRKKYKENPFFKLRSVISAAISYAIKNNDGLKNGDSCLSFLEYDITTLKLHLEKQFEPWMNWSNHGKYRKTIWKDEDQSTWTWNIDHIMPQSELKYKSMGDDNFKKCWALDNLRPLSALQNILDGTMRIRHKKKDNK